MRLYATTTSERASKGQGGNEYLDIVLFGAHGTEIMSLNFVMDGANYKLSGWTHDNHYIEQVISENTTKGKKGICDYCEKEKENISDMLSNSYCICKDCSLQDWGKHISELETMKQKEERGKKKKDECNGKHENVNAIINCEDCSNTLDDM